jgi:BirA family biotin operon repressor/biotin-[acetyl-CoA-carboxylase] ligase
VDQSRDPIDPAAVEAALGRADGWTVLHTDVTGSSNADLALAAATRAAADRTVLITEEQTAGRGRMGRSWHAPCGSSLMISMLVRPGVSPSRRGWVGALLGLSLIEAVRGVAGLAAELKWPNDVLIGGRKCAGILAEAAGVAVVVGAGLNVTLSAAELPKVIGATPATSLHLEGARCTDRTRLAAALLDAFADRLDRWYAADGDVATAGLLHEYRTHCATLGSTVRVELPDGLRRTGTAVDVDDHGALVVRDAAGERHRFTAADVVHLRPAMAAASGRGAPRPPTS